MAITNAEYYQKNKIHLRAKARAYYWANKPKMRADGREWRRRNPGRHNAHMMARYASKINATPKWLTKEQRSQIDAIYIETSRLTRNKGHDYQVDHVVPLKGEYVCGLHVPWNLQILTREQNQRKSNRFD